MEQRRNHDFTRALVEHATSGLFMRTLRDLAKLRQSASSTATEGRRVLASDWVRTDQAA